MGGRVDPSLALDPLALGDDLRRVGRAAGLDAVGFAGAAPFVETRGLLEQRRADGLAAGMQFTYRNPARSTDPSRSLPGARSLVVGARRYLRVAGRRPEAAVAGRVARYSWSDEYAPLRRGLEAVAARLAADGWQTRVLADDNALVDREAARRAGLGWYGKNTNLLMPGAGSWFVLGSVVTDAALPPATPVADGCGACERCLPACPTGALVAPGVLDARRCLAWLVQAPGVFPVEYRVALGDRMYGCDVCQDACPAIRRAARTDPPGDAGPDAEPAVDVLWVLGAGDDELLDRLGRWYIPRREPRHLRRNALLVLGNVADPDDPDVEAALRRALADPDALVRAHAVWAAARLGRRELLVAVAGDPEGIVQAELRSVGTVAARGRPRQEVAVWRAAPERTRPLPPASRP